ncbi:MAG: alanine racemase, partial [Methyloceanibacter sp.]
GRAGAAECAAAVKADAYGTGIETTVPALARAGCRSFFVAQPAEGRRVRAAAPQATVYVLNGLKPGCAPHYARAGLRPVLGSREEVEEWAAFCRATGWSGGEALQVDTGMSRLGIPQEEAAAMAASGAAFSLVMSHLACADDPEHPKSEAQRASFDRLRARLPKAIASLANSAGILLGARYVYDLVRPGIALYGGKPCRSGANPFAPVVRLEGRILQVRNVGAGETVGYGATRMLRDGARIATVAVGYADGFFRALSAGDGVEGLVVSVEGHAAPVLGRVSMDLITIDVTGVPERVSRRGAWVELIGPNVTAQDIADRARTIDYEVLTSLGRRAARRYVGGKG